MWITSSTFPHTVCMHAGSQKRVMIDGKRGGLVGYDSSESVVGGKKKRLLRPASPLLCYSEDIPSIHDPISYSKANSASLSGPSLQETKRATRSTPAVLILLCFSSSNKWSGGGLEKWGLTAASFFDDFLSLVLQTFFQLFFKPIL